ncbi:hypothetical protein OLMES_4656 [Oleiphilus messinensis]|uniref:DUF2798 domain-containing protein n=1 Tax=Oleiphilus messinensis TaxID=141451 RepID=A0A1Y0IDY2_9GAMM|nr:DUF2798 domain-containing protein [Oleiphilus messinensis]ARU58651.1 hypothetical protein OLMES_4656 [Oleiphilus messinensis]
MIPRKYGQFVFSFFMALFMSGIMSFIITVFNMGLVDSIVFIWLKAWSFAFAVALPTINLVSPIVRRVANAVIADEELSGLANGSK